MFEKDANKYADKKCGKENRKTTGWVLTQDDFQKGAEFGYNKANEWHKVSDKLPEMDVLVYFWNSTDDFPVVARRHIPYGHKEWVWDCKWGSGFTVTQLAGKDYLWKEIVLPELPKESE